MRLGIVTPVLTMLPGFHAGWEVDASFAEVVTIARAADRLGYDHLTCSEHVAVPADVATVRGARYYDPLATFGHLSAVTEHIRLATYVLVLGYHHPLEIAKRYGTLDVVCRGRLVLGVGVGSLREEFDLLGRPFDGRGELADRSLRDIRASLGRPQPPTYEPFVVDPCATGADVEIWVGGRTRRSLRRAVDLADGWAPFGMSPTEVADALRWAATLPGWGARSRPLEVVLQSTPVDPLDDGDGARRALDRLRGAGTTIVTLRFRHRSAAHYVEQLEAMAEIDAGEAA